LLEECGLQPERLEEVATYDVMFPPDATAEITHHAITTLFRAEVTHADVTLDTQSVASQWQTPDAWLETSLHPFVKHILEAQT
jgi:hypothetical protein